MGADGLNASDKRPSLSYPRSEHTNVLGSSGANLKSKEVANDE